MFPRHWPLSLVRLARRHWSLFGCASCLVAWAATSLACAHPLPDPPSGPVILRIGIPIHTGAGSQALGLRALASLISSEGLIRMLRNGRHAPQLAERWESSADGLSLRLYLHDPIRFHDGSHLTADLVKASLDQSRTNPSQVVQYPMLGDIAGLEAPDRRTVVIKFKQRSALLLDDLEVPIRKRNERGALISTGPFFLESETSDLAIMRANPYYHRGRPRIDVIQLRPYGTVRTAWAGMMRGDVDLLYEVPGDALEFVEKESSVRVFEFRRPYVYTLLFNPQKPMFGSPAVRRALNFAVDRQALRELILHGRATIAHSPMWPEHWAYRRDLPGFTYDPMRADRMLTEAGLPQAAVIRTRMGGQMPARLRFTCQVPAGVSPHEEIAILIQKQFFDLGVDMQIEPVSIDVFLGRVASADYEAALIDINGGPGIVRLYTFWHSADGTLPLNFGYRGADNALDAMRTAQSEDRLFEAAARAQRALHDDPPAAFLGWSQTARAVSQRFQIPASEGDVIGTLWQWQKVSR